jgi:hypothetical protein
LLRPAGGRAGELPGDELVVVEVVFGTLPGGQLVVPPMAVVLIPAELVT